MRRHRGPIRIKVILAVVEVSGSVCGSGQTSARGSGFLWKSTTTVVTSLHIVAGCKLIKVRFNDQGERAVLQARPDKGADLVELTLSEPFIGAVPLTRRIDLPRQAEEVELIGYPGATPTYGRYPRRIISATFDERTNELRHVLPTNMHDAATSIEFDLSVKVLRIQPGAWEGGSGAPIVSLDGELVGVGSGSLEANGADIGWAIRSHYVETLNDKPIINLANLRNTNEIFLSAFREVSVDAPSESGVQCGTFSMHYKWRRTFGDILASHDRRTDLEEIVQNARELGECVDHFTFKIWKQPETGAYIANSS